MNTRLIAFSLLLSAVCSVDARAQGDTIQTNRGRSIRGVEVVEATTELIKYKRRDQDLELPASRLDHIIWGDAPEAYDLARAAMKNGDFSAAANLFTEAAGKIKRPPFEAECRYQAGLALARGAGTDAAKAAAAATTLSDWLAKFPDGNRMPDVLLNLGRAQTAAGDPAQAQTTLKRLGDSALAKGWAPIWNARAQFELARAQVVAGEFGKSRSTFKAASSAAETAAAAGGADTAELIALQAEASVGVGESMVQEGKFDDALRYFRDLSKNSTSPAVQAAAKAGEGEAIFLQAMEGSDGSKLREAQVALAEANFLDPTAGETSAKALYYSGRVLLELGPDRALNSKQRAMSYFQTVVQSYPESSWASLAAEALKQ